MDNISVGIAEDHEAFREGLKITLSGAYHFEVIWEATDGKNLLEKMEEQLPQVVLLDLNMPLLGGREATRLIKARFPSVKIVIISMYDDPTFLKKLDEAGADTYLLKNAEPEDIRQALYQVTGRKPN